MLSCLWCADLRACKRQPPLHTTRSSLLLWATAEPPWWSLQLRSMHVHCAQAVQHAKEGGKWAVARTCRRPQAPFFTVPAAWPRAWRLTNSGGSALSCTKLHDRQHSCFTNWQADARQLANDVSMLGPAVCDCAASDWVRQAASLCSITSLEVATDPFVATTPTADDNKWVAAAVSHEYVKAVQLLRPATCCESTSQVSRRGWQSDKRA